MSEFTQKRVNILKPESEHYLVSPLCCHILALLDNVNAAGKLLSQFLLPQKWGWAWGGTKKEQIQSLQDETLKSDSQRTSDNLLAGQDTEHPFYFIIWVLWAVTRQKCHACKIEAQFSKPFDPLPSWNIYSRDDTLQDDAESTELGIRKPGCNPSLSWTCCGLCKLLTPFTSPALLMTSKTLWILHRTLERSKCWSQCLSLCES